MSHPGKEATPLPKTWILPAAGIAVLVLAPLALAFTEILWLRWLAIMALAWWLPGGLLVAHWRLSDVDLPAAGILALGLGLCWMLLLTLLIHWLPGPIQPWLFVVAYEVGALVLLATLYWHRPLPLRPTGAATWAWLLALFLLAVMLRLPGLGYHEMHIDEVVVLRRAANAIQGEDDVLLKHTKGPGEILVATVVYRALGTVTEATARLPYGLMSVGSVLAVALLGRRLFSSTAGFWAGVLFAMNGFALGLSRIVQYQPAVLLLSALAVLAAWEFSRKGQGRWLVLAAILSACGLVMHYEFALLAPVLLVLAWMGWQRAPEKRSVGLATLAAGIVAVAIVAATYLPPILNPHFSKTQDYLGTRLGGLGAFNLAFFVEMSTFYNSIYFFAGLVALMLAGIVLGWRTARRPTLVLVLWFTPFFILYVFVMRFPGTHFYLLMASWSLLAALPLAALTLSKSIRPWLRWGLMALVVVWLAISAGYLYLMFFRQSPEYLVNYEQERVPFYWAPYGKEVPAKPRFGFPIQEGWKAVGMLADWGYLGETFASNERSRHLQGWYLSAFERAQFEREPDWILVADHLQEPNPFYNEDRLQGYQMVGEVRVRGEPRIELWARESPPVPYLTFDAEDFAGPFDQSLPVLEGRAESPVQAGAITLGETMVLESASLEDTSLAQGSTLHLVLAWRPLQALDTDYKLFVHVAGEDGQPKAQWDGLPALNTARTSQWPVGEAVQDHVLLRIPDDMLPGHYQVLVGLYDGSNGERLGGQAIEIATITIR